VLLSTESKTDPSDGSPRGKLLDFSLFSGGTSPVPGGLEDVTCRFPTLGLLDGGGGGRRGIFDWSC